MDNIFKTEPAVFAVGNTYQIFVPVTYEALMWVRVGDEEYYDDSNGILRSAVTLHKMTVPMEELDREKKYTICWRKIIERKPYFTETEDMCEKCFDFKPVFGDEIFAYQIADAHNLVCEPVGAAERSREKKGRIDFLIMNGDIPDHSGRIENFDNIFEIAAGVTHGNIPIVFSRGNHDTRGIYAENIADYTPCQNGNSYYSFRLGSIWGIILDCGEDKTDDHPEYGNTVCCHAFRKRETRYIENIIKSAENEYLSDGVKHRIAVVHNPFTWRQPNDIFNIEPEIFTKWARLLENEIRPELMICGHLHKTMILEPGEENDLLGHPCPIAVGSLPVKRNEKQELQYFVGSGFTFKNDSVEVVFNDNLGNVWEEHNIEI